MTLPWQQIGLLMGLSGFLLWKHWKRVQARRRAEATRPTGHGFEAAELKARLGDWRKRHQQTSSHRRCQTAAHEAFVVGLRKSLLRLSFFRSLPESETPSSDHDSQRHAS